MKIKAIVLGAGKGTRMHSDIPKVLHSICGKPMIKILLDSIHKANVDDVVVVIGPEMSEIKKVVEPYKTVVQQEQLGTAHAVLSAQQEIQPFDGCVLILFGDSPLILPQTLEKMIQEYKEGTDVTVLGFIPTDARCYGRLIIDDMGLKKIVEYKDATNEQRSIKLCNSGVMCINGKHVLELLKQIKNTNASGEYYLTDIVEIANQRHLKCNVVIGDVDELHGINTPEELVAAEEIYRHR